MGSIAGTRRVAVPAQGAGHRAGGAQLPAAVRRRALRAQPAEPEDDRHRRGARQPGHVPAVAGAQRLRQRSARRCSTASCSTGCASAPGVKSAALATRADPRAATSGTARCRSRDTRPKDGEDMQAFMNARLARLLQDDEDPVARGARLHGRAMSRRNATVAIVNRRFAEHFFPGTSAVGKRIGFGGGPETKLDDRDRRRRRRLALRGAARGRAPAGVHPELGQEQRGRSTCARTTPSAARARAGAQRGAQARRGDAGLRR